MQAFISKKYANCIKKLLLVGMCGILLCTIFDFIIFFMKFFFLQYKEEKMNIQHVTFLLLLAAVTHAQYLDRVMFQDVGM